MAPTTKKKKTSGSSNWSRLQDWMLQIWNFFVKPQAFNLMVVSIVLLVVEAILNVIVILKVPYTEIDWVAYMQEVEPVLNNGTYDYSVLKGDTGPLVYPAGFVWIFSGLYLATDNGTDIRLGQYLFLGLYLLHLALVFRIMIKTEKVPPFVLILMSLTSYRIHSIFVLRLFNDPVATTLLYLAVNCFISDYWYLGSLCYSLAVSVKMNILLYAPALFFAYLATQGFVGTLLQLSICALVQIALAWPFLTTYPVEYLKGSFDLGRVFLFKWTVNWRFLPEEIFISKSFHLTLLGLHVLVLFVCIPKWWKMLTSYNTLRRSPSTGPTWSSQLLVFPLFCSNFIGMVFARSLHYQFYVWYYHQLPYLLWCTRLSVGAKLAIMCIIEFCWNTYPSTNVSSGLLHGCHLAILFGILSYMYKVGTLREKKM